MVLHCALQVGTSCNLDEHWMEKRSPIGQVYEYTRLELEHAGLAYFPQRLPQGLDLLWE